MKYWRKSNRDADTIVLLDGTHTDGDRIVSLTSTPEGAIEVKERCDHYYNATMTRQEIVAALQEAINWIKNLP